ncbi:PilZ domain-containing protein, partial [Candidatus Omnitrophota bacterium]
MLNRKIPKEEQRKYKRLDTIFPVEFQLLDKDLQPISNWHQGFSQDISKSGVCLTVNNLAKEESQRLIPLQTNLILQIHFPLSDKCFLAYANIVWIRKVQELPFEQFVIGLNF